MSIWDWIAFVYIGGFVIEFVLRLPLAVFSVSYYVEVFGEKSIKYPVLSSSLIHISTSLFWPHSLYSVGLRFFMCDLQRDREALIEHWQEQKRHSEREK